MKTFNEFLTEDTISEAIKFDIEDYVDNMKKKPSGVAEWTFNMNRNGAWTEFKYKGDYKTAKKMAEKEAKSIGGISLIVVGEDL